MPSIPLNVNGGINQIEVNPEMPLLWVLRDMLNLTGTKYSCGKGLCGSCTVHLDGEAVRSCITRVGDVGPRAITTIEGLDPAGRHPLQLAWISARVPQCGYCQPGQIMTAAAMLIKNPQPSEAEIVAAMSGNLCRCGTYQRIKLAIQTAAAEGSR